MKLGALFVFLTIVVCCLPGQTKTISLTELRGTYPDRPNDRPQHLGIPAGINDRISDTAFGCTIVMAARDGLVLVGNNEDRNHLQTVVTFVPATQKYYGRIVFGYDDAPVQGGNYPCWRYRAADKILSESKKLSVDLIRRILEDTHQEGRALTVYSNIYDLKRGVVYIYNLRNFKGVMVMNLSEELKKGQRDIGLGSLFQKVE
jgi:hypothetical protein